MYPNSGIDLDFETERIGSAMSPSNYETVYVTSHKGPCRSGCFSQDGQLVATGSVDSSIKILDVERMIAKSNPNLESHDQNFSNNDAHPVIRTLYDHIEEVSCLQFHPKEQYLISGSHDMTIKMFDYSKPSVKRAFKSVQVKTIKKFKSFLLKCFYLGGSYCSLFGSSLYRRLSCCWNSTSNNSALSLANISVVYISGD